MWLVTRTTGRAGNLPASYKGPTLIGECNPGPPSHWILRRKDEFPEDVDFVKLTHKDNPTLWDAVAGEWTEQGKKSIRRLQSLTGIDYQRLYLGEWVSAEGTVYDLQEAHLGTGLWQKGYPTQLAIDPSNGSGPYAALVIQQFDQRVLVIDEFYKVGGTDEDLASWFKSTPYHAKLTDAISDPAKPDTIKRLTRLLKVPVRAKEGKKDITAQINSVKATMRQDPVTKQAPMVIDREKCPMLQDEFSQYVWQQAKDGGKNISSTPIDSHNHLLDAYAYWVTTKHLTGPQQHSILAEPTVEVVTGLAFR
jgi:phage terminase large subunit